MNVQQLIDELMKISDKSKQVVMVWNTGTDFNGQPFLEESVLEKVNESEHLVVLLDDMKPKF